MTKRSIFAKIFLITFALFSSLVILLHASVYFFFPVDLYRVSAPDDFEEITGSGQEFSRPGRRDY